MSKNPFKFLDSYTKEDKDIFFGRETEIEELYQKVFESKILLVCGVSGTGKSSLIDCGLANKFEDSDWLPINIRRGTDINDSLRAGISRLALTKVKESKSLTKQLQSLYLDHFKPIYLIFDQFEELFIFGSKEERKEFIQIVKTVVDADLQCKLLFVMREEYLAGAIEFEREIPTFLTNRLRIEKMTWTNAKQVIEEPCKVHGIKVEEGLAEIILGKLSPESTEVELTYLQVLLDKLYHLSVEKNKEKPGFTGDLLREIGDVSDLLGSFLEDQIIQLEDPDTGLTILKSFVSLKGTRKQISEEEIQDTARTFGQDIPYETLKEYLQQFVNLRILKDKDETGRYELRHDSLATKIYEKISIVEKEMMEVRQFVENAFNTYEKREILLNREDLKYLEKYESNLFLPKELDNFVLKSKNYEKSKSKVVKYITTITAIVFGLSLVFLLIFIYRTSIRNHAILNANQSIFQVRPVEYRYKEAKEAYLSYKSPITQKGIFNAYFGLLQNQNYRDTLSCLIPKLKSCDTTIVKINFSENGEIIFGYTADNKITLWNIINNEFIIFKTRQDSIIAIELAPNNKFIATISVDSVANIWDIEGNFIFSCKTAYNSINKRDILKFSSQRNQVLALSSDNDFVIYDIKGNIIQKIKKHTGAVNGLDISENGQFIATASCDFSINIWYFNTIKDQYDFYCNIDEHKDTVWSVNFSKNNQFIVTASADSNAMVFSVNGEFFYWVDDFYHFYWNDHYSKICYAEFSNSEREVILTRYGNDKLKEVDLSDKVYNYYSLQQNYDHYMIYKTAGVTNKRMKSEYLFYSASVNNRFNEISFSNDSKLSIVIPYNVKEVWLLNALDYYKINEFSGNNGLFSPDGQYLLIVNKNKIKLIAINIDNIINMVDGIIEFQ